MARDQRGLKPRLYFASPLFNPIEKRFNESTADALATYFDVYLPQRDGGLLVEMVKQGVAIEAAAEHVFRGDIEAIRQADVLVAVLDGRTIDEGVAFELGVAYSIGKTCIGIQTDVRRLLITGNNPMVEGALGFISTSVEELLDWARGYCEKTKEGSG
jgi:nucleoside 2-deoxyribosyltransferase